jgi:TolA-binding protein
VEHRENYSAAEAMRQTGDFRESIGSSEIIYRPVSSEPSALDKPLDRVHNAAESRFHSRDLLAPPIDEPEITELASATTPESTGSARVEQRVGQHSGRDGSGRDISLSGWEDDTSAKASKSQLSLSDEFFMDDLNYRPRSRLKQVMLWLLIGGMFAVGGFIGVKWYSAQHQVDTQKGSSDISQVATKQRDVPSVETQPSAIKTDQAISMQVPDGGQDVPDSVDTVRASPPVERIYLNSPNAQTSAVKPRPEPRPVGAEPKTKRRLAQPVAGGATINQVDYLLKLAMQHRKAERLAQAESLLRRALSMRPKQPAEVLSALGQVLYERDKTSAALNYLLKAYNIDPRSTGDGLFFLGGIYYSQNKSDKASTFFRAYLNYFPNGKHARDARIMLKK